MRKGITIVCVAYNEEKRAEQFFESIKMFDEIILIDRSSTDRTCEIAGKYGAKIYKIPYVDAKEEHLVFERINKELYSMPENEWVMNLTFADIAHPKLYNQLIQLINRDKFYYTIVQVPWVEYLFGKEDEYIPYCHYWRPVLRKKEFIQNSTVTHHEIGVLLKKEFRMKKNKKIAVHHMTYFNLQYSFFEQHVRYAIQEVATYYSKQENPKKILAENIKKAMIESTKIIYEGVLAGRDKEIIKHGTMIALYRSLEYYLAIYLILWADGKKNDVNKIFENIYSNLQKNGGKVPKRQVFKMWLELFGSAFKMFGSDIIALLAAQNIVIIMTLMIIWDDRRKESVEEVYSRLKNDILSDK